MKRIDKLKKKKSKSRNLWVLISLVVILIVAFNSGIANAVVDKIELEYKPIDVNWSRTPEPEGVNNNSINLINTNDNKYWMNKGNYYLLNTEVETNGSVINFPRIMWGADSGRKDIVFDYNSIINLLNPTQTSNVWDGRGEDGKGTLRNYNGYVNQQFDLATYPVEDFYTWEHFNEDSWRMFRGEFELGDFDPKTQDVYLGVLGENGPELVMPVNDFIMVMVDGKATKVNYATQAVNKNKNNMKFKFPDNKIEIINFYTAYHRNSWPNQCVDSSHQNVSKHTDSWHVHLNESTDGDVEGNIEGATMIGNITEYLDGYKDGIIDGDYDGGISGKNHKIEVFGIDNTGGGGGTKFDVFVVDKPRIDVEKTGYIKDKDGNEVPLEKDGSSIVDIGKDVFYEFKMKNDMKETVTNIEFEDELLGIKINSTGIYKKGASGEYDIKLIDDEIRIIKRASSGEEIDEGINQLDKLNTLNHGESVTIKDIVNMKYFVTLNDAKLGEVKNIVVGKAKYFNDTLTGRDEAEFVVKVEDINSDNIKINIKKDVQKIVRNGEEIFNKDNISNIDEYTKKLMPGDIVNFTFEIINNSKKNDEAIAIDSLNLMDILSDSNYTTPKWTYTCKEIGSFNGNNFLIKAGQTINVLAEEWIVPEPKDGWSYDVTNTVNLYRRDKNGENHELGKSSLDLKILLPSIKIKKVVINRSGVVSDLDKSFTLSVTWNDNKLKRTIEVIPEKEYEILNLRYGVEYKLEEVVPINYELVDIEATRLDGSKTGIKENSNSSSFQLGSGLEGIRVGSLNEATIVVTNKKVNDSLFFDESIERNIFNYKSKGVEIEKGKVGVMN